MNTLLINLTRFGDLLQTQPTISGLAQQGHSVGLMCLDNFASATGLLQDVSHVLPVRGGAMLSALEKDWRTALGKLWNWRSEVNQEFMPDRVVNLTATLGSRLLSRYMTPEEVPLHGFGLDAFGFGSNTDPWTTFLQASTRLRGCSPYNLVDLYWMAAGLGQGNRQYALRQPDTQEKSAAQAILEAEAPGGAKGYVAFQLGASEERRQWPTEHFAVLGDMLWRDLQLVPVLLGAENETALGQVYAANTAAPFVSLIGKTSLPQLAATLTQMKLLVSNDTGTMHLAAGLDVSILGIFLATAQPWDTGPYLEGSCSLEPDLPCHPCPFGTTCPHENTCRSHISPQTAYGLVRTWCETGEWANPQTGEARIWRVKKDTSGFMDLLSLSGHEQADRTLWVRQQRHFYGQFLDRPIASDLAANASVRDIMPISMEESAGFSEDMQAIVAAELSVSAQLLHLLTEQGAVLVQNPVEPIKKRFLSTWQRLQSQWDNSKYLNVLGYLWMSESQQAGQELGSILALAAQYKVLIDAWSQSVTPVE